jgi:hypothetical protein
MGILLNPDNFPTAHGYYPIRHPHDRHPLLFTARELGWEMA